MNPQLQRRRLLCGAFALTGAALAPRARACEYFSSQLRITHPWTRATPAGAESAVLCMRFDEVAQADRLIGLDTPVAQGAELVLPGGKTSGKNGALDLAIPAGRETLLSEAGPHIRLLGLTQPLELARSYPLKLVFENGGVVIATLNVDYMRFA
jgi:copper(I)-binding protein